MEQIIENNELNTLSVNLDSELDRGGKSLQPSVLLKKLKDSELPLDKQNYKKKYQTTNKGKQSTDYFFY